MDYLECMNKAMNYIEQNLSGEIDFQQLAYFAGSSNVNYRIEKKNSFKMIGVEKIISMINGENFKEIPSFWKESFQNGTVDKLDELGKNAPNPGSKGLSRRI
jgi:hypothetical protein